MTERDALELAYKNGRKEAIAEVFEELDAILSVDQKCPNCFVVNKLAYNCLKENLTKDD